MVVEHTGELLLTETVCPCSFQLTVCPAVNGTAKTAVWVPLLKASGGSVPAAAPVSTLSGPAGTVTGFPAGLL